jgi:Ca2+-transporting ATPase
MDSVKEALDDKILFYLAVAALFTIITGMVEDPATGWLPGFSIYIAILVIVLVTAWNDWNKDKLFVNLQSDIKNEYVTVIRGKQGTTSSINIYDLNVGDVALLEAGCRIPADCIMIEGQDVTVDEARYNNDHQSQVMVKNVATKENLFSYPDPFLISGTIMNTGACKVVVAAVGKFSRRGITEEKLDTETKTPLQKRLENLAARFTKWGVIAALMIAVATAINTVVTVSINSNAGWVYFFKAISKIITNILIIIMVAVPEGLPMTIAISLAFSVKRMIDDGILVKNLESPEMMGSVTEICTGKTGTLTYGDGMTVEMFYTQSREIKNNRDNTFLNCDLDEETVKLIKESILFNCSAHIEMNDEAMFEARGNGTEVGLINFLQANDIDVNTFMKQKNCRIEAVVPFDA